VSLAWWFGLIAITIPAVFFLIRKQKGTKFSKRYIAESSTLKFLKSVKKIERQAKILRTLEFVMLMIMVVLLVIILSRPQKQIIRINEERSHDVVLCIDTSTSMLPYLSDSLQTMKAIIKENPTDRYSIVGFGSAAYTIIPLTRDITSLNEKIDYWSGFYDFQASGSLDSDKFRSYAGAVNLGFDPNSKGGTDVTDGLVSCVKRFGDISQKKSRSIIMLSDLEHNDGTYEQLYEASKLLPRYDIDIYVLQPDTMFRSDVVGRVVDLTQATVVTLGDKQETSRIVRNIVSQALNKEKAQEYVNVDWPQPFWIALLLTTLAWSTIMWYRWRDAT
jgi:uncharacterized membrane protein YhaH (DUF805 family)